MSLEYKNNLNNNLEILNEEIEILMFKSHHYRLLSTEGYVLMLSFLFSLFLTMISSVVGTPMLTIALTVLTIIFPFFVKFQIINKTFGREEFERKGRIKRLKRERQIIREDLAAYEREISISRRNKKPQSKKEMTVKIEANNKAILNDVLNEKLFNDGIKAVKF